MWCSLTPVHRAPRRSSEEFPPVPFLNEGFGVEKQGTDRRGNCREMMVPLWRSKARALQSQPSIGESPWTLYPRSQRGAGSPSGGPGRLLGPEVPTCQPSPASVRSGVACPSIHSRAAFQPTGTSDTPTERAPEAAGSSLCSWEIRSDLPCTATWAVHCTTAGAPVTQTRGEGHPPKLYCVAALDVIVAEHGEKMLNPHAVRVGAGPGSKRG